MNRLMTAAQVAEYTQLNVQTIWKKARDGDLPCYRIGTAVRFKQDEIDTAMKGGHYAKNDRTECRSNSAS